MTRDQRRRAIEGPVAVGGATMTPRLMQRLLNDVGDNPDQLPILQHALMRTWETWLEQHRDSEPLDLSHYEAIGGMATALSRHGDEVYAALPDNRSRAVAERMFKRLTDRGLDARGIRRPTRLADLCAVCEATQEELATVIEAFRRPDRSLLMPPMGTSLEPDTVIDISHESLMRVWERLKDWVDEEAESARMYQRLAETAVLHEAGKAGLWRDPDLQLGLEWRRQNQPNQAWAVPYHPEFALAMRFLDNSRAAKKKGLWIKVGLAALLLITAFSALVWYVREQGQIAFTQSQNAETQAQLAAEAQRERATAEHNAAQAQEQRDRAETLTVLAETKRQEAEQAAEREKQAATGERRAKQEARGIAAASLAQQPGREIEALVLAVQAAGPSLLRREALSLQAVKGLNGAVTAARQSLPLRGHTGDVTSAAFSPDGARALTGSTDDTVRLWDTTNGRLLATLRSNLVDHLDTWFVTEALFSPDGARVIVPTNRRTIIFLDAHSGQPLDTLALENRTGKISAAAFLPDGTPFYTTFNNGDRYYLKVQLWNAQTDSLLGEFEQHGWAFAIRSPDGSRVVTGGQDHSLRLWNAENGNLINRSRRGGWFKSGVFSPVGTRFIATLYGHRLLLDTSTGEMLANFRGTKDFTTSSEFSPDGTRIVGVGGRNHTPLLINALTGKEIGSFSDSLGTHTGDINCATFSPDGTLVVTANQDRTARLWDVRKKTSLRTLQGHADRVFFATFSSDGTRLVTSSGDHTARLWDTRSDLSIPRLKIEKAEDKNSPIRFADASPDGTRLVTLNTNNNLVLK